MTECAASVSARLATLPPTPERAKLIEGATRLQAIVAAKGPPSQVADLAHGLAGDLLKAYPVPLAPARVPDFARGATLFAENCASCHGARSEERRVGKEWCSTVSSRWSAYHTKKKRKKI